MLRLGLGLLLVGWVVTAQAAQPDEDYFEGKLDLITTRLPHPDTNLLPAFRVGASVVFTRQPDSLNIETGSGSTSQLAYIARLQQEISQAASTNSLRVNGADRFSLPHILSVGFQSEQVNVTVRPNSALVEVKQFKIVLKPSSTFVTWRIAF